MQIVQADVRVTFLSGPVEYHVDQRIEFAFASELVVRDVMQEAERLIRLMFADAERVEAIAVKLIQRTPRALE